MKAAKFNRAGATKKAAAEAANILIQMLLTRGIFYTLCVVDVLAAVMLRGLLSPPLFHFWLILSLGRLFHACFVAVSFSHRFDYCHTSKSL